MMLIKGLYTITTSEKNDKGILATIHLNKDHEIFKGHFPGNPIMPGVCMIQIIKELTEETVGKALILKVASNVKFMAIIDPSVNPHITINIEISDENGEIKVKNSTSFQDTVALKLNATFKIAA